jgi:hypothetical protein
MASEIKTLIYKLLSLLALGGALALGIITLHFYLAKAEIIITANQIPINLDTEIQVPIIKNDDSAGSTATEPNSSKNADTATANSEIELLRELILETNKSAPKSQQTTNDKTLSAKIKTLPITITYSTTPQGEGKKIDDFASGLVTIYNELSFNQPLVTNTRLLTPDGALFRIQKPVTVPARGSIEVEAKASFKGEAGNIAPTSFTIPGLSPARQKQVYAKNTQPFAGGAKMVKILSEKDFTVAQTQALETLKNKALKEFNKQGTIVGSLHINLTDVKFESFDKPGEQKTKLEINASAIAQALLFNQEALLARAKLKLTQNLPADQTILAYNEDSFSYEIVKIDQSAGVATIKTYLEAFATLGNNNNLIDPRELAGLKAKDIQAKLLKNQAVQEVRVKFSPFWVTRAPRIVEKIKITVKKTEKANEQTPPKTLDTKE